MSSLLLLNSLAMLSFVFELFALFLSFYFKNSRIFFITLALLCMRFVYVYASLYQAHLFVCLFLPFVFVLFALLPASNLVLEKRNLSKIAILIFVLILGFFLSKNTNFNAALSTKLFENLDFVSDIAFVFFLVLFMFFLIWCVLKAQIYLSVAFVLSFVQFLFGLDAYPFFEFASLFFVLYMFYHSYKIMYFDLVTKLPNQKSLKRYLIGLENYQIFILHFNELEAMQEKYALILLKAIAKLLRKNFKNYKIFSVDKDFVFVVNDELVLKQIELFFSQVSFKLENEKVILSFALKSLSSKASFEELLREIKEL
ncbi:hypothetical protein DMB95_09155 [Campylobacter sp. MIT 12-8780]|uniref:hypothetical protein n=1 Tax=Campylobacter sp. MIT 12-8780 TaxID=2202200 RepID=UPI00115F6015|nr:hypothetical protein [Campylobacter sp. MIT 12-8780]TQR40032.1 hypothetical protein DMB95_09155 [Campylobacter sp. MIT 12-8780]